MKDEEGVGCKEHKSIDAKPSSSLYGRNNNKNDYYEFSSSQGQEIEDEAESGAGILFISIIIYWQSNVIHGLILRLPFPILLLLLLLSCPSTEYPHPPHRLLILVVLLTL